MASAGLQAAGPAAVLTATRADPATTPADLMRFQHGIGAYGGDLLLSPAPTPALGNIPPAIPRELGMALVPLAAWAGVRASRRASPRWWAAAGAAAGLAFLASPVAGIVAALVLVVLAAFARRPDAWPALAAFALLTLVWLGPLGWHAADLGGFVSTTQGTPIEPSFTQVLWAIAVLLALAAGGVVLLARGPDGRMVLAVSATLALPVVAAAAIPGLGAVPALTRTLHYVPAAALGMALPGGVAAAWLVAGAGRWRVAGALGIAVAACASAATASAGTAEMLHRSGGEPVLRCEASLGSADAGTIAVIGPAGMVGPDDPLALTVFARTGAPLLMCRGRGSAFPTSTSTSPPRSRASRPFATSPSAARPRRR